ncbi:poly(3-hydroxybutyrate) depolymerase-like [Ciona intestinalis]
MFNFKDIVIVWTNCLIFCTQAKIIELPSYNVDRNAISMSGFSSGGFMTSQFHFSMSKMIMGSGIIAGGPYHCASSITLDPPNRYIHYMNQPDTMDVNLLINITKENEKQRLIDPLSYLADDKVYIIAGSQDTLIAPGTVEKTYQVYQNFTKAGNIKFEYVGSEHGFPTVNYGGECAQVNDVLMNSCNFSTAHKILNHIYGDLQSSGDSDGTLFKFNATKFSNGTENSMHDLGLDDTSYVYVPSECENEYIVCRLHVVLHGCTQGASTIGDVFVSNAGYNEIGAANNIIMLYPQAKILEDINPYGCWDWIGDTGPYYATNKGPHIVTIYNMMKQLTGDDLVF